MAENAVLRRMATAGREEHQARAMSVPKAMRLAMARSADDLYDMAVAVIGATAEQVDLSAMCKDMADTSLLVLLDGPQGLTGVISIDPVIVGALIQQQTIGRVNPPSDQDRKLTATDAAMMEELIDEMLGRAATLLEGLEDQALLSGFRFGARVENTRLLELALEEPEYKRFKLTLDIAGGTCQGEMIVSVPLVSAASLEDGMDGTTGPSSALRDVVMTLPSEMNAVLHKLQMPFSKFKDLAPGDILRIPITSLYRMDIRAPSGRKLANARLGQVAGMRAVRIEDAGTAGLAVNSTPRASEAHQANAGMEFEPAGPAPASQNLPDTGGAVDDLPDLPDLPPLSLEPDAAVDTPLPDLPDLPDLDDLPDLPPLNMDEKIA